MSFLSRVLRRLSRRTPLQPRVFTNTNFPRIPQDYKIEEETIPHYLAADYYPVRIGEVFASRYQVVGKLGFGLHSTVWLARDLNHVALKVYLHSQSEVLGNAGDNELAIYKRMAERASRHPGRGAVRALLDSFRITGPDGEHLCLVHPPLGESVASAVQRTMPRRLRTFGLRFVLGDILLALEYLHEDCQIIHTGKNISPLIYNSTTYSSPRFLRADIRADNIMFGIVDTSILTDFEEEEIRDPSPRKEVDGRTIYASRTIRDNGRLGPPVLCDFSSAAFGEEEHLHCVQPRTYRSPEIWDLYEERSMFGGIDPEHNEYRRRAHLAEIMAVLGPPPKDLLARGNLTSKFFSPEGKFIGGIDVPAPRSLEATEINLDGEDQRRFLEFVRKMVHWDPAQRSTAGELFQDPWLQDETK
ncbi:hypothetical protein O1611_g1615 [Lasiodiplodia mahajangana]|uniref:Uncharacterized protein n=1 Tax=Lasiodiplodia mahajangana TaxID=1108764 RepID=A0ACC2JWV8_9PEZI|nr:hypothetical protein O1611_g1615 [Lasiodiplodia mahajangana]